MTENNKRDWYQYIKQLLEDRGEEPGVVDIRADLCNQIIMLPADLLFELCQDIGSAPCQWLEKPRVAFNCSRCRESFGECMGDSGEVDYEQCQKRFWEYANLQAKNR